MFRTLRALGQLLAATGKPIAGLIRIAIGLPDRATGVAGMFSSGNLDTSAHHDSYLAEAWSTSHEPEDR